MAAVTADRCAASGIIVQVREWIEVIAWVGTFIAAVVATYQLLTMQRQNRLSLGSMYIERYWKIRDDLSFDPDPNHHACHQQRYLILCEDEFEAANHGLLDRTEWDIWHGYLRELRPELVDQLRAHPQRDFTLLRTCLAHEAPHQWRTCPARGRQG